MLNVNLDPRDARPLYLQIWTKSGAPSSSAPCAPRTRSPRSASSPSQLVVNPRTVLQAYRELEREGVIYVGRGQGTFVVARRPRRSGAALAREVAKRALREARRNGLSADELLKAIRRGAVEEDKIVLAPHAASLEARR